MRRSLTLSLFGILAICLLLSDKAWAQETVVSSGSGFFVSTEGHIVTNAHVVAGCTYVRSSRGGQISRVAIDEESDLALYISSGKIASAARLKGGRGPRLGEAVVAIGFPLKGLLSPDAIITTGTISALAGIGNDRRQIQITAPVQPGNSGGPLLGESGSVVGVVVGKLNALKFQELFGDLPQNVNFAVSLGTLQSFLNANGVPYTIDYSTSMKTPADIAADASRHAVLLECLESMPESEKKQDATLPTASPDPVKRTYWDHNGSLLYLVAEGNSRKFVYERPRPGMVEEGVRPGTILFSGRALDRSYEGTAHVFKRGCKEFAYEVSGTILDNTRVVLGGRAPYVDENCKIIGYFADELGFSLMR